MERHQEPYFKDGEHIVVPLENEYADGYFIEPHRHRRHQLLYASSGVVVVATPHGAWVSASTTGNVDTIRHHA